MRRLDVLLINPGGRKRAYQALGSHLAAIEPPIWAGQIATFLRRRGLGVAVLDANAEELDARQVTEKVAELKPLLTAVVVYGHNPSASTQVMPAAGEICSEIKEAGLPTYTLLVGGHVAALPERTLREEAADFVCGGEGPYTVYELARELKAGVPVHSLRARDLWYRGERGEICRNPPAPLVENLDEEMPQVAWDLLPMEKYRAHNWHCFGGIERRPYAALYTTLGCPFHCTFCCIQAPFRSGERALGLPPNRNSYRLWSPRSVLNQLEVLVEKYGVQNIKFADELFLLKRDHVEAICDGIIERGYNLNIWAYARVDTLSEELLRKFKRAGVNWLALGIESGSARVRKDVRKAFPLQKLQKGLELLRRYEIAICGNYMFGLPEDDHQSMQETLDLALEVNAEWANFYCAMAYPGSALYQQALSAGWPLPSSWSGYAQLAVDTFPLPTKYLSPEEVLRFRDYAFQAYYSSPRYLDMIERKYGKETVDHIKAMTSVKLKRRLYF